MTTLDEALAQSEKVILTKWIFGLDATLQPATKDAGPQWTTVSTNTLSADATGVVAVTAAPTSGQKICIDDIMVSVDTAMSVLFEEETSGTDIMKFYMAANSSIQITPRGKIKLPTADKKLTVDTSVAGNISVTVSYHSEA